MDFSQLKQLVLVVALLTLVGCASAPKPSQPVNQPSSELARVIGSAAVGDTIELPADHSLGMNTVIVDRTYFAASGSECRRLRGSDGEPIQRVVCKNEDGQWRFARDLRPVSAVQVSDSRFVSSKADALPLVPSAGSALLLNEDGTVSDSTLLNDHNTETPQVINDNFASDVDSDDAFAVDLISDAATDMVQRELIANETLWSFAKRTTGNALNWKAIAELNNITDAKTLAPGAQLNIPVELVSDGG